MICFSWLERVCCFLPSLHRLAVPWPFSLLFLVTRRGCLFTASFAQPHFINPCCCMFHFARPKTLDISPHMAPAIFSIPAYLWCLLGYHYSEKHRGKIECCRGKETGASPVRKDAWYLLLQLLFRKGYVFVEWMMWCSSPTPFAGREQELAPGGGPDVPEQDRRFQEIVCCAEEPLEVHARRFRDRNNYGCT